MIPLPPLFGSYRSVSGKRHCISQSPTLQCSSFPFRALAMPLYGLPVVPTGTCTVAAGASVLLCTSGLALLRCLVHALGSIKHKLELYHRNMIYVLFHPVPFFVTNWLSDGSEEGPGQAWGMMRMMRKQKARGPWMSNQHLRHVITFKWSGCLVALLHF